MKALQVERSVARFAAARAAAGLSAGAGSRVGPLRLADIDPPALPGPGWQRLRPRLSGICGSDLATVEGRSSRWFEPVVSFPFVPGHEVVAETDSGARVVIEPVLACAVRGMEPPCPPCAAGQTNRCERLTGGHLQPGLQTGYCSEVGGGWSLSLVAHDRQLHAVPDGWSDEAAVMVEPTACGVHGALAAPAGGASTELTAAVIGAGTLGLATLVAASRWRPEMTTLIV
ncbi:MAG: alcohol dehydrogenase catalytic domain-containing protein, partial [Acidimicrobiales bacterium]